MANLARGRGEQPLARRPEDMFTALRREMDRVFEDFSKPFDIFPFFGSEIESAVWSPRMNIEDRDDEIFITLEVPGVDEKDVEILTDANGLTIRGQKRQEVQDKKPNYYRLERSFGSFERTIPLPLDVDAEKAEAKFKNGVLEICLPKSEKAKEHIKRIPIKTEGGVRSAQASVTQQHPAEKPEESAKKPAKHEG